MKTKTNCQFSIVNSQLIDVAYFIVILACAHFFWKFTVLGDEGSTAVLFFGIDISRPFDFMVAQISQGVYGFLQFFGYDVQLHGNRIVFSNGQMISVVWGCAGIKQMYIFLCLIALFKGSWRHKLWYIPAGFVILHFYNILRIALIAILIENNQERFEFLHGFLFKYLFYFLIFMMWVGWNEIFVKKNE